ncbi:MAG TPA: hypothetical protein VK762_05895 [Polyangiaceae bacterium]|jgi:hypothetical protein|nr:hypothetical protein [Polyangiaceae bacterium]
MMRSSIRRTLTFLAFTAFVPVLVMGCPKKEPVVEDAAPPTPATVPTVTELAPLTDDGGPDAADAAPEAGKKPSGGGPSYNANQMKIKACCNAMRAQAKAMGSSPEAFQINALAAQCDTFATQVGPAGNAPELNQLRQILKSLTLPSACQM